MKNYPEKYAGVWSRYYILGNFPGKYPENHWKKSKSKTKFTLIGFYRIVTIYLHIKTWIKGKWFKDKNTFRRFDFRLWFSNLSMT
jgi:hypothetical protein